jgi:hypothetical protein
MNPRILVATACAVSVVFGIVILRKAWHGRVYLAPQHPSIKGLANGLMPQDFAEWQKVGTGAVPVLVQALEMRPGPLDKAYSNTWSKLPVQVQSVLPVPSDDAQLRAAAAALLADTTIGAHIPLPVLSRALQDQFWGVRMNALACLDRVVLPQAGPEKLEILTNILTAATDKQAEVRMSAVYCLRFYKEASNQVTSALVTALADDKPDVRIRAAMAFYEIDPAAAEKARAVSVAFDCLEYNGLFGSRALAREFLQRIGKLPPDAPK